MTEKLRPLSGLLVNLSISENDETESLGFPKWQINRTTLQIVSALFSQGAGVIFGHDWRDDGVMEAVHGFALQMQETDSTPLLWNMLAWPDRPRLSEEQQERLSGTLRIITRERPKAPREFNEKDLRALALTEMRAELTRLAKARICLGGRGQGHQGRMPGVYEEALIAVKAEMPLYLTGLLGGATQLVIDIMEGNRPARDLPEWEYIRDFGWQSLRANGLDPDENRKLFRTPILEEAIVLVLTGLSRVAARNAR